MTAYEIAMAIARREQAAIIVATPPGPVTIFLPLTSCYPYFVNRFVNNFTR
jgi:hypothetical protein